VRLISGSDICFFIDLVPLLTKSYHRIFFAPEDVR
jgi:hypothetical protein